MKTVFKLLILCLLFVGTANAQTVIPMTCTVNGTKTLDTTTAAVDTSYFYATAPDMNNGSIQIVANRISGTCVVTANLEVSNNGTNWYKRAASDTAALLPAANSVKTITFTISSGDYLYYRVRLTSHSTASTQLRGFLYRRKL